MFYQKKTLKSCFSTVAALKKKKKVDLKSTFEGGDNLLQTKAWRDKHYRLSILDDFFDFLLSPQVFFFFFNSLGSIPNFNLILFLHSTAVDNSKLIYVAALMKICWWNSYFTSLTIMSYFIKLSLWQYYRENDKFTNLFTWDSIWKF